MGLKNINYLNVDNNYTGNERRDEIAAMPFDKSALCPKTVVYKDIDDEFRIWCQNLKIVTDSGVEFPTMTLYSNQRFSEYSQSWKYVDDNNNLLLNFKTVNRESNPMNGSIQSGLWNIPGDRFYTIKRLKVLDDNGTESLVSVKLKQPTAIDLNFKLSLFTNMYQKINEFNMLINELFASKQCYIAPNGYYMPMTLESVGDESEYSLDDRQFYSQTYTIRVHGFILTEDDIRVYEEPIKVKGNICGLNKRLASVEIEDLPCTEKNEYKVEIMINFPKCVREARFTMDESIIIDAFSYENLVSTCTLYVNGIIVDKPIGKKIMEDDVVKITVRPRNPLKPSVLKISGTNFLRI